MNLRHLTDSALLADTKFLAQRERELSLKILHHLKEIERRRLYSDLRYPSLFEYAVKELGYSEPAAIRRIQAARLLADMPELDKKIEAGHLNLTNLSMAANLFKNEDIKDKRKKKEILARLEKKSKKESEKILMEFAPPSPLPREIVKQVTPEFITIRLNVSNETYQLLEEIKGVMAHNRLNTDQLMSRIFKTALAAFIYKKYKFRRTPPPAEAPSDITIF